MPLYVIYRFFLFFFVLVSIFVKAEKSNFLVLSEIKFIGNKVTKERILLREFPCSLGDTISKEILEKTLTRIQSNLMNTHLFNVVNVNHVLFDSLHFGIYVDLIEQWYTWPIPIFEIEDNNFNTWLQTTDWYRLNYGMYIERENFRGRREELVAKFQMGYSEQFALQYKIPFIDKKQKHGLGFTVSYKGNHEIAYNSENNKRKLYRNEIDYARNEFYARIGYQYRKKIYNTHSAQIFYYNVSVLDTIRKLNQEYLNANTLRNTFFVATYQFKHDKRNFANYPVKGHYFDIEVSKYGLGIFSNAPDFTTFQVWAKKYFDLGKGFYFSAGAKYRAATKRNINFYLQKGLGYGSDFIRSFEYYVIDGQQWVFQKSQLRYGILENKLLKLPIITSKKFNTVPVSVYPGVFFDNGYVKDFSSRINPLANKWIYGGGVSLDFVTFYEMVLRTEYSVNMLGESGIFLHFVAPI
jgi:outer membrane protein assembly factor BamA